MFVDMIKFAFNKCSLKKNSKLERGQGYVPLRPLPVPLPVSRVYKSDVAVF